MNRRSGRLPISVLSALCRGGGVLALALAIAMPARADGPYQPAGPNALAMPVEIGVSNGTGGVVPPSAAYPVPVLITGGAGSGGTSSNFGQAFPGAGTAIGFKNVGGNMDWGLVDASHLLEVNCAAGCSGGTSANNADTVASASTGLGQQQAYPFLWNGATFDRWYGDKTNGAFVNVKTSVLPTGAALDATLQSLLTKLNGSIAVTGTFWQATQPVSASSLPLPNGAATATNQTALIGSASGGTAAANSELVGGIYSSTLPTLTNGQQVALQFDSSGRLIVTGAGSGGTSSNFSVAFPGAGTAVGFKNAGGNMDWGLVDASHLLEVNCAAGCSGGTSANNADTVASASTGLGQQQAYPFLWNGATFDRWYGDKTNGAFVNVKTSVLPTGAALDATLQSLLTKLNGSIAVTGTFWQATQPVSASSLPLPALAATSTKQSDGSQKTQIVDGAGNVIASTSNNLNVLCANCSGSGVSAADESIFTAMSTLFAAGGGFYQTTPTSNPLLSGTQGTFQVTANRALFTNLRNAAGTEVGTSSTPLQVSLANTGANGTAVAVSALSLPLPTGAATAANQTGVQGSASGGTAAANSELVGGVYSSTLPTLTNGQQAALQFDSSGRLIVTDNQSVPAGANTIGNVGLVAGSAKIGVVTTDQTTPGTTDLVHAAQSGVWTVQPGNTANTTAWKVDGSAVTQPVSAASLPLPTGAASAANQTNASQKTQLVDGAGSVIASTSNNLNVQCANCSGSGVSAADEASFTAGTSVFAAGGGFYQTTATSNPLTAGQQGAFQLTANRALFMNLRNAAGTEVGTAATPLIISTNGAAVPAGTNTIGATTPAAAAAGGATPYHLSGGTAASNNSTSIKGSAGTLYDLTPINTTSAIYFLKLYDSATAPTCSSATNLKHVYPIPQNTGAGGGFIRSLAVGEAYANGIGFCVTAGGADTDNSNAATGVYIEASYK